MFFARAGYAGIQAVAPVIWSGDPAASFDDAKGLPAQVRAGINAGLSGVPFWGSDISGYTCLNEPPARQGGVPALGRVRRALVRHARRERVRRRGPPARRPSGRCGPTPRRPRSTGDYARLHTRLFPYTYAAAQEATHDGHAHHPPPDPDEPDRARRRRRRPSSTTSAPRSTWRRSSRAGATTRDALAAARHLGRLVDARRRRRRRDGDARRARSTRSRSTCESGGIVAMLDPSVETLAPQHATRAWSASPTWRASYDVRAAIDPGRRRAAAPSSSTAPCSTSPSASGAVTLPAPRSRRPRTRRRSRPAPRAGSSSRSRAAPRACASASRARTTQVHPGGRAHPAPPRGGPAARALGRGRRALTCVFPPPCSFAVISNLDALLASCHGWSGPHGRRVTTHPRGPWTPVRRFSSAAAIAVERIRPPLQSSTRGPAPPVAREVPGAARNPRAEEGAESCIS